MNSNKKGKIIVISAPSGCGKSTIIHALLDEYHAENGEKLNLQFSVSATNRAPREGEEDGRSYYFLTTEEFQQRISEGEFIEWEEVYPGRYYGTLRRAVDSVIDSGDDIILDVDVKGAVNVKRIYGERARTIFILPPSLPVLYNRLVARGTDSQEVIAERFSRAEYEIGFADKFDFRVVNDDLDKAVERTFELIHEFIK